MMAGPHRRYNPLWQEWVLVSPHRTQRPWQGQVETDAGPRAAPYDATCYLCPGNVRANGDANPRYESTLVFDNDYPALLSTAAPGLGDSGLLRAEPETGRCRVVCFSPRHDLSMATLPLSAVQATVAAWTEQFDGLGREADIRYVQIFENRGAMMGASSPHPHGQIWASSSVPDLPAREGAALASYQATHGICLLCQTLQVESEQTVRVVVDSPHWMAVVPYWAVWPFEILVLPRRHVTAVDQLSDAERSGLAEIMQAVCIRYDNLFRCPFPYTMGLHQRPTDGQSHDEWHLHAHYFPPLLRSATVRKFMVGYELLCSPQRDITAEQAALRLREVPSVHYLDVLT